MRVLGLTSLDNELQRTIRIAKGYDISLYHRLVVMYYYGLRCNEAVDFKSLVLSINSRSLVLRIPKTSTKRTLEINSLVKDSISFLLKENIAKWPITVQYLRYFLVVVCSIKSIYIGKKRVSTHLFRHVYAKRMYKKVKSIENVAMLMGISPNVAKGYVNSTILI